MTKIEKIGKLPVNSRIFIDYTQNPVKVDFEYPDPDKSSIRKSDLTYIISLFFTIFMFLILFALYISFIYPMIYPHADDSYTTVNNITVFRFEYYNNGTPNGTLYGFNKLYINYTWNDKNYSSNFIISREGLFYLIPYFYESSLKRELLVLLQGLIMIALLIVFVVLNSYWVAKIFKDTKWGNRKFPELNKKMHDAKFSAEYSPENFPKDKNIIEIPLFKNMYMDYDALGDFAEQLIKISIIEHPFNRLTKKGNPFSKKPMNIIKKPNVYLWKCILEFKDKPKDGSLVFRWS